MNTTRTQLWLNFIRMHFLGGGRLLLRRYSWELPQTFVGFWAGTWALIWFREEVALMRWGESIVVRGYRKRRCWGGVCFGAVIIGDSRIHARVNNALFMHEYGHCLQSAAKGPIYLTRYGLPSLISAYGKGVHFKHPVEQDANLRAEAFFATVNGFERWPQELNPVADGSVLLRTGWWEYLPGVWPVLHLAWAVRQWWKVPLS